MNTSVIFSENIYKKRTFENEKEFLRSQEKELRKNDFVAVYNNCPEFLKGKVSDFLLHNGIDIFKYLDHVPSNCFAGSCIVNITLPDTVKKIKELGFHKAEQLKTIFIPGSVKEIESAAFYDCTRLDAVFTHHGVETLGENVFAFCKNLTTVFLTGTIKNIDRYALSHTGSKTLVITCLKGSAAYKYCEAAGINFKAN